MSNLLFRRLDGRTDVKKSFAVIFFSPSLLLFFLAEGFTILGMLKILCSANFVQFPNVSGRISRLQGCERIGRDATCFSAEL